MGQVWTLADWNNIIQQVNILAENPEGGCDPIEPLSEVTAPHKWSKTDIQQVHDKLIEICDTNSFGAIPDKWKQSIIDEINGAIAVGWCKECCLEPCTDAGEEIEFSEVTYASGCYWDSPDCGSLPPDPWEGWPALKSQALSLGFQAASASFDFSDYFSYYCAADKECQKWEDKITAQEQVVADACGPNGNPAACAAAQATLAQYQAALEQWQGFRDEWQSLADEAKSQADSYAQQQADLLSSFTTPDTTNMWHLVMELNHPWSSMDCEQNNGNDGPARCLFRWTMTAKSDSAQEWTLEASGMVTPNGLPYATYIYYINAANYRAACCGPHCDTQCNPPPPQNTTWRIHAEIDPGGYGDCP